MRFSDTESEAETFIYNTFSCDVDFFVADEMFGLDAIDVDIPHNPLHITARFYDGSLVRTTRDVHDLVAPEKSFGTITLEVRSDDTHTVGFTSGYLDASIFTTQKMVRAAVDFVQEYLHYWMMRDRNDAMRKKVHEAGFYHHVCLFDRIGAVEHHGKK